MLTEIFARPVQFKVFAIALAGSVAVAFATGAGSTWWLRDQMAAKAQLKAARDETKAVATTLRRTISAGVVGDKIGAASAERQVEIHTVTREIIKEVPRYVTVKGDAGCTVPVGFVRLHDAAA